MTASVQWLPLSEIHPCEKNPRFNEASVDAVANSIRDFGFRAPIIVDKTMEIIAGHTRYKAAVKMGMEKVPVIIADDLTKKQADAYRIADNSSGSHSLWDMDLLGDQIKAIEYDMSEYGLKYEEPEASQEEDINISEDPGERQGGTIRFNLSEPQVQIIKDALATVTGQGYDYGNMNSNGNKLTEICSRWMEIKDQEAEQ